MDNELITEKSWWKINWKWLLPVIAFILAGAIVLLAISEIGNVKKERENGTRFDQAKWQMKDGQSYIHRNGMLKDLVASKKLKKLKKEEVTDLLGQPDRIDGAYLFYRITQQSIGLFPLHTTTLVVKISDNGKENPVLIHE